MSIVLISLQLAHSSLLAKMRQFCKDSQIDAFYLQWMWPCEVRHRVLAKRKEDLCAVLEDHLRGPHLRSPAS